MGQVGQPRRVMLICAVISRYEAARAWAREQMSNAWGPIALVSEPFLFDETEYYAESMGTELRKEFVAFERLINPGDLADRKLQTNAWEQEYAEQFSQENGEGPVRPLNLDSGYLAEAKLVLATTKDRDHRLYLSQGIYAEVTLTYRRKQWNPERWTYADYRRTDFHEFFERCRQTLRQQ